MNPDSIKAKRVLPPTGAKQLGPGDNFSSFPDHLRSLAKTISELRTPEQIDSILIDSCKTIPGFVRGSIYRGSRAGNTYHYKGYELFSGLRNYSDRYAQNIVLANELGLECAPEIASHITIKGETVTITHHKGCENQQYIPYNEVKDSVSLESKQIFLKDIEIMIQNELMHDYVPHGTEHWFVNPTTGKIHLNSWESLTKIDQEMGKLAISDVKELLGI